MMTSTFRVYSYAQGIGCSFKWFAIAMLLSACNQNTDPESASPTKNSQTSESPQPASAMEKALLQFDPGAPAGNNPHSKSISTNAIAPSGVIVLLDTSNLPTDLPADAALFVYLREPGKTMPLAVQHYDIGSIPGSMSFQFENPMSGLELVARLSPSGQVNPSANDIQVVKTVDVAHPMKTLSVAIPGKTAGAVTGVTEAPTANAPTSAPVDSVTIELSYTGKPEVAPSTTVFVVARSPGTRMPRAARKLAFSDLPLTLTLTDSDSMVATNKLSDATSIEVRAHIATNGQPSPTPGDWLGSSASPSTNGSYLIEINEQLR